MRTLPDIQQQLGLAFENGLTSEAVNRSRQLFGTNVLTPLPREPAWKKFLAKFDEPIIKILLAAALLSMIVDILSPPLQMARVLSAGAVFAGAVLAIVFLSLRKHTEWVPSILFAAALVLWPIGLVTGHPSFDGLAVMIAVLLATGVAFLSEFQSDREFEMLNERRDALRAKVKRGGEFQTVNVEEVVVGDVVLLETGDEIPADGRLLKATDLEIDQSLMTGESEPAAKQPQPREETADGPDQVGCLYTATQVISGAAEMAVTEVGDATYLGQIARGLNAADEPGEADAEGRVKKRFSVSKQLTPLQQKLEKLAQLISRVGYAAASGIFLALLVRGIWISSPPEVYWPTSAEDAWKVTGALLRYFMYMVIVIVVAVPEGLPMSVTISLALAMRKMSRANTLVRQLVACETVGSTTIICSDKTGTMTQNQMQVVRLVWPGQTLVRGSEEWITLKAHGSKPVGLENMKPADWFILNSAINSTANLETKEKTQGNVSLSLLVPVGNSTEGALLLLLHEAQHEYQKLRLQFAPVHQVHFSSERKRMTTVVKVGNRLVALVKGAPEWLLGQSKHYLTHDGGIRAMTAEASAEIEGKRGEAAAQAMRTLAFGYAPLPAETTVECLPSQRDQLENGLVYIGFAAIHDPLREDVKTALSECKAAGIQVMMITGDNIETARAIAGDIGLLQQPDDIVLTSAQFNELSDADLKEQLPRLRVLARARPLDKLRMVKNLQELAHVVAVTGDGTNDAPALKKADVGLSMGRAGTEVAKEASKIVLLDDSFATIVKAIHWGRALYENIQRFLQFQLTINLSALVIAFLGPFIGVKPPFTILQLLWINVIMDTFAAVALCSEPPRAGLMRLPPKRRDENILTRRMMGTIVSTAIFFVIVMLALLVGMAHSGWFAGNGPLSSEFPELTGRQVSIFFTVYVLFQVWNEINCRSLVPEVSGLKGLEKNPVFLVIIAGTLLGQVLIVRWGGDIFKVEPLAALDWFWMILGTSSVILFAEVMRRLRLLFDRSRATGGA